MTNLFDDDWDESVPDKADDSDGKFGFRITGKAGLYPRKTSVPSGDLKDAYSNFYDTETSTYKQSETMNQEPFSYFPEKQYAGFDGKGMSGFQGKNAYYQSKPVPTDNSVIANISSGNNAYKSPSNRLSRSLENTSTGNLPHNAAAKAFAKLEQGDNDPAWFERAERLDTLLHEKPQKRIIGNLPHKSRPENKPIEVHSFEAVKYGFETLAEDNARIERVRQLEQILRSNAQQAQLQNERTTGWGAYQNDLQTAAHEGISTAEQLENIAWLYGQPIGKIANQLGLSFANGVIESLPAKIMGLGPRVVNYVSQSFGGDKVVGDFSDIGNNISRVNKESRDHDPYFTNSDGTKTAAGEVMEWGNRGAENLFDAGFVTLASGLWGAEAVAAGAIPLNTAYSYFRDYQETMNQLNEMQGHVLGTNPEIMTHFRWNKQLGKSDDDALNEAKNAIAKKRASLSAGGRLAREVIDLKLSGAVPEQKESLLLEFGKNLSFNVLADKLGQYIQRAMENGQIVHTGDTAM